MKSQHLYRLYLILRTCLGGVFLWASWSKIVDPAGFAEVIRNYRVLPDTWVNWVALLLPWTEAVCGLLLVLGRWVYGCVLIINTSLVAFTLALAFNWYRGLDVGCGCFSVSTEYQQGEYLINIIRDIVFLAAGVWIAYFKFKSASAAAVDSG
jgi:uncharacterized membrane protein YphA (DoxX/SURF4 family)